MPELNADSILDLGRKPISPDAPCGLDAEDDETLPAILAEVGKLDRVDLSPDESPDPDWYTVERLCTELLQTKSKHIEAATCLVLALFKRNGYAGLSAGLGMCTEMVRNFWDGLFPERPRARKSRIEALGERFADRWFRDFPPRKDEFDALDQCAKSAEELSAALNEKMPDDPPNFKKFLAGLKEKAAARPKKAEPAPAAPPSGEAPSGDAAAADAGGAAFSAGEVKDVGGAKKALIKAAQFMRDADPSDPVPYLILRDVFWAKVSAPTADTLKETVPPEKSVVEMLTHQFNNKMWPNLLKSAEAAFRSNDPLWMDPQRYLCAALTGSGPQFSTAANAVMLSTAMLVKRLGSAFLDMSFRNGQLLCAGETKMWLEAEVMPLMAGRGGSDSSAMADGRLAEAADNAKKLASQGKVRDALASLQAGLSSCNQRRDRLLWRLRIAQLCLDLQRVQLAAPLLEECRQEIEEFRIDEWEPQLSVDVARTLYRCRKQTVSADPKAGPEAGKPARDSFAWLCRLDPLAALDTEPA